MSLCFRCEHRAEFLEDSLHGEKHPRRPRMECGDVFNSKTGCYMFKPCKPVVTVSTNSEDIRPRFGPAFLSKREYAKRILDEATLTIIYHNGEEVALGWTVDN